MTKVVSIVNQKGGVGKTTTSVNLSACLAELNYRVLVVDIDPQGNTTSGLGIEIENDTKTIYQVLCGNAESSEAVYKTEFGSLYVCPSDIQLAGSEVELVDEEKREFKLRDALEKIKYQYDYVLIDCPPSLNLLTLNALIASDSVLVPVQCEYYALEGLSRLMQTIKTVKAHFNPKIEIDGVLLTMFDARTNLSIMVADEVKKFFPKKVYKTVIPRNVRLSEAPSYGEPITSYDKYSKGAESYIELAKEFSNKK